MPTQATYRGRRRVRVRVCPNTNRHSIAAVQSVVWVGLSVLTLHSGLPTRPCAGLHLRASPSCWPCTATAPSPNSWRARRGRGSVSLCRAVGAAGSCDAGYCCRRRGWGRGWSFGLRHRGGWGVLPEQHCSLHDDVCMLKMCICARRQVDGGEPLLSYEDRDILSPSRKVIVHYDA